jgi:HEPN domain-containing protein
MDSQEKFDHWLKLAKYDLETAEAMFSTGRWLYVAFTCQQAIEKLVKGLYIIFIDDNIPRIHELSLLVKKFEHKLPSPVSIERYIFLMIFLNLTLKHDVLNINKI